MSKKILFLDDRSKRIHVALDEFPKAGYKITIVTNVIEALRYLAQEDWAVVSLDHDLNGCDFEDPDSPTCGMELIRYLEKTGWPPNKGRPTFHIHSKNLFAAHLMIVRLKHLGFLAFYLPWSYDKVEHMKYDVHGVPLL